VVLVLDVEELVGRDRSLSVRKSMVADTKTPRSQRPSDDTQVPTPSFTSHVMRALLPRLPCLPFTDSSPSFTAKLLHHLPITDQPTTTFLLYNGFTSIRYSRVFLGATERRNGGHCAAGATKSPQYAASHSPARTSWHGLCPPQDIQAKNGIQAPRYRYLV
jgi:hypothetical protein